MTRNAFLMLTAAALAWGQAARKTSPAKAERAPRAAATHNDIQYPKLNPIKIPPVDRYALPNGMTVYLVEDKELPLVYGQAIVRTGERWEPVEKAGLAGITLRVMRTGGSATRSGDALNKELDRMAASVETGAGDDSSSASMFVLKQDTVKGIEILNDLMRHPAFPEEKIALAKTEERDSISRRNDEASGIHAREMARLLYGKATAYGKITEYASIESITRDDMAAFHRQYFQPENVILGVWGDIDKTAVRALIEKTFGTWARGGRPRPEAPKVDAAGAAKGLHLIKKDDVNQSTIGVGMLLGRRDQPDYTALVVMTSVLGGGFGSRMFTEIRTNLGLAYQARAGYAAEWDHDGSWSAHAGTKSESTIRALEAIRAEIARMKAGEPTDEELSRAKDGILKGEAFDYDSTGKVIGRLMMLDYYGYPADYMQRYRAGIDAVTKADVVRVARKYLTEDRFVTLVLGNAPKFDKPLDSLGPVTELDVAIPGPKAEPVAAATAESASRGRELLIKARQAHGGPAIERLNGYAVKADMTAVTPQGDMTMKAELTMDLGGRSLMKMVSPMGEIAQGFDGQSVWVKTPQGVREMPSAAAGAAKMAILRDTLSLLRDFDKPGYTVQAMGPLKLGESMAEAVLVKNEALKVEVKLFLDAGTGILAGKSYTGQVMMGAPGELMESYTELKESGGLKLPARIVTTSNGRRASEQKVSEFQANPGLEDGVFRKPQERP